MEVEVENISYSDYLYTGIQPCPSFLSIGERQKYLDRKRFDIALLAWLPLT